MIWMGDPQTRMLSLALTGSTTRLIYRRPMPLNSAPHWNGLLVLHVRLPAAAAAGLPGPKPPVEAAVTIQHRFANGRGKTAIPLTAAAEFRPKSRKPTKRPIPSYGASPQKALHPGSGGRAFAVSRPKMRGSARISPAGQGRLGP